MSSISLYEKVNLLINNTIRKRKGYLTVLLPDIINIPSGLKDASKVDLLETGFTLKVDNYNNKH